MRPYTIYIDAISKCFAATGVRVGWSMGPAVVLNKMKAILSHVGAWAPMPEQKGLTKYIGETERINAYFSHFKSELEERLRRIYEGITILKAEGFSVEAVAPEAAIYLTIKIDLAGKKAKDGNVLEDQAAVTSYLLQQASLAVVPFYAFGAAKNSPWYRLSVGTCKKEEIDEMLQKLRTALQELS
jgi:aspartate aminotransferase